MSNHQINISNISNIKKISNKYKNSNSKKYKINHSTHSTVDYCSLSSTVNLNFSKRYSDYEGSMLIISPKKRKMCVSTCSDFHTNENHDVKPYQMPLATSSPIKKTNHVQDHYDSEKLLGFKQKQQKPFSQMNFNSVTNIINNNQTTKPTPVTLQSQNVSKIDSSLSEVLQMELSLKMFRGKMVPYLNSVKHDILQVMNSNKANKQMTNESKLINSIVRNNLTIMELNKNTFIKNKPNEKQQSTLSLIKIDSNVLCLNLLNDNLEHVSKILESAKWTLNDTEEVKKSDDYGDLKLPERTKPNLDCINNTFSFIQPEANDSFDHIRELNKSNSLLLPSYNNIVFHESSLDQCLENNSLKYANEQENAKLTEFVTSDISSIGDKLTLHDKKDVQKSSEDLNTPKNDNFLECYDSDQFGDLNLRGLTTSNLNSTTNQRFSSIQPEANDSFDHIRESNESNTLPSPSNNSIVFDESSQDQCLRNSSLKYASEQENAEFTEFVTPDNSSIDDKWTLHDEKKVQKSSEDLNTLKYDNFLECHDSDKFSDLKLLERTKPNLDCISNTFSSIQPEANDSFNHIRELNESNSLQLPSNNNTVFHESSQDQCLENNSLKNANEQKNAEFTELVTPDISTLHKDLQVEELSSKSRGRYTLRKHSKRTDHYSAPFTPSSVKKKSKHVIKTKYKDVFVFGGSGKNKTILQYKVHSVLKANASELIKKMCPTNNNDQNNTTHEISNLKPNKNVRPCLCGIFPSQVPSSWNDSLHKSLHKNLHKLRFNCTITQKNMVTKYNDSGFLYDVIKIADNCDVDRNQKLTLKNVQDFINLEINYTKNSIKNNHSIFLAVNPDSKIIGYLEVELLDSACVYQNRRFSDNLIAVKFGVSKLWVMVKYRNNGVATRLLKKLCEDENLKTNDIAFAFHGSYGMSFIKKFFANSSVLMY